MKVKLFDAMNKVFSNIPPVEFAKIKFTQKIIKTVNLNPNLILRGISENSSEIGIDYGFFALSGSKTHGALYVKDVINVINWFLCNVGLYLLSRNMQPVDNFWQGM